MKNLEPELHKSHFVEIELKCVFQPSKETFLWKTTKIDLSNFNTKNSIVDLFDYNTDWSDYRTSNELFWSFLVDSIFTANLFVSFDLEQVPKL